MTPIDKILPALHGVLAEEGKRQWMAICPAHDDVKPSLSISETEANVVLLNCHAGCNVADIVKGLGLEMKDLFPQKYASAKNGDGSTGAKGKKVFQYAMDAADELDQTYGKRSGFWRYDDATGQPVGLVVRWDRPDGKKILPVSKNGSGWILAQMKTPRPLYRLPEVLKSTGQILVTEGEKCADAARALGFVATTSVGGAEAPGKSDWAPLAGKDVVILPDNDDPGRKYADKVADILKALSPPAKVRILALPGLNEGEDIVDLIARRREDGKDDSAIVQEVNDLAAQVTYIEEVKESATAKTDAAANLDERKERPRIDAGNLDLESASNNAWNALTYANDPPSLFQFGAAPARIEFDDEGNPIVRTMTIDRMRHRLARDATWFSIVKTKNTEKEVLVAPPVPVVKDVLAYPSNPLPVLTRIVEAPIFASDGTLQTTPGYSPNSRTFFAPAPGFSIPNVPASPTTAEIGASVALIHELIGDFPFTEDSEKAHTFAALLLPFARELIDGPTPLHSFEAPMPGTGKTLLVNAITLPALGRTVTAMSEGRDEDEWRKRLLAKLHSGPSIVLVDNVRRRVDSGSFASVTTAYPLWEDRLLGKSEIIRVPVRCLWLMTGNNPAFSSEMARRTIRIRLDAKRDQPWLRDQFKHQNLIGWAKEHRGEIVAAALTLIRAWMSAGSPAGIQTLGMFESWARVMGGILAVVGVPGFLGNLEQFYETADAEGATWRNFVAQWWNQYQDNEIKAAELYPLAMDAGMPLGENSEQSQKIRLGQKLTEARDRVFSITIQEKTDTESEVKISLLIKNTGKQQRAMLWRLTTLTNEDKDTEKKSECVSLSESFSHTHAGAHAHTRTHTHARGVGEKDSPTLTDSLTATRSNVENTQPTSSPHDQAAETQAKSNDSPPSPPSPEKAPAGPLTAVIKSIRVKHGQGLPDSLRRVLEDYEAQAQVPGANITAIIECIQMAAANAEAMAKATTEDEFPW